MRSFGKHARLAAATAAMWLSVCLGAEAQTARERFEAATAREEHVRAELTDATGATAPAALMTQVTQVMIAFENIVRRFPTSGYADNALFQGAALGDAAFEKFSREDDRDRAARLYRWLIREYPHSPLLKRADARLTVLDKALPSERAVLTGIDRSIMASAVRVTVQLDREVEYVEQGLSGPPRVFFDLKNVQLTPELLDKVLSFPTDIVNKIRLGRHPDNTVRVVLDLHGVSKYSVFTLYKPFRLVIDAERAASVNLASLSSAAPTVTSLVELPRTPVAVTARPAPAEPLAATRTAADLSRPSTMAVPAPPPPAPAPPPLPATPVPVSPSANAAGGFSIARQLGLSVSRIVIDPGHGGHDPGVLGKGLTESALVLDVALRLEKLLQKEAGVEVVLTRRTDVYVPLEERTEIANRQHADMFLSIHANASRNADARGIETFFLSFASSPDAETVAARENSASTREMHHLPDLVKAITLNNKLDESRDLAHMVQDALVANLRKTNKDVRSRGVKKAPFVVLIGAQMPSVLAEISFVSNRQELSLLKTPAYRQKIAESLFNAVRKYRRSLKNQTLTELPER